MTNIKALSIFLLRLSTGLYLTLWGIHKLINTEQAIGLSNKFYAGLISIESLTPLLGIAQIIVGVMIMLGLFRSFSYWAQFAWYAIGLIPILGFIVDPFGLYLVEKARLTWFPSTTLLFASMVILAFREYDTISVDHKRGR